jgi:hypothetical protein
LVVLMAGAALSAALASNVKPHFAALSVLGAFFGTPAFAYTLFDPSYSHAASFSVTCLLLAIALYDRRRPLPPEILGTAVGLVAMMRWQDIVLGIVFLPRLIPESRGPWRALVLRALRFGLPIGLLLVPQMVYWSKIYGRPLLIPPGPDFLPAWRPGILPMLFSTWNGAFVWSPLLLVGLLGLRCVNEPRMRVCLLAGIILEVYVSAVLVDWWGGRSFGARRMVALAPLAAYGLALTFQRSEKRKFRVSLLIILAAAACWWNSVLILCQRYGALPWNPGHQPDYTRYDVPGTYGVDRYGLWDYPRLVRETMEARDAVGQLRPQRSQ